MNSNRWSPDCPVKDRKGDQKRDISKVKIPDCLVRFPYFWCDGEVNIGFHICNKLNVFDRCFRVARVCCKVLSYAESRSKKTAPSIFTTRIDGFTVYLVYWFIVETLPFQKYWTVGTTSTVRKKKQKTATCFSLPPLSSPNIRASLQRATFSRMLRREFLSARQGLEISWKHRNIFEVKSKWKHRLRTKYTWYMSRWALPNEFKGLRPRPSPWYASSKFWSRNQWRPSAFKLCDEWFNRLWVLCRKHYITIWSCEMELETISSISQVLQIVHHRNKFMFVKLPLQIHYCDYFWKTSHDIATIHQQKIKCGRVQYTLKIKVHFS